MVNFVVLGKKYHNGPLTPGQQYAVHQRNYANDGTGESLGWIVLKTPPTRPPPPPPPWLYIIIGVVVAFIICIVAVLVYRRRRANLMGQDEDDEGAFAMNNRSRSRLGTMFDKIRRGGLPSGIGKNNLYIFVLFLGYGHTCISIISLPFNMEVFGSILSALEFFENCFLYNPLNYCPCMLELSKYSINFIKVLTV